MVELKRVEAAEAAGTQLIVFSHYPSHWVAGYMPTLVPYLSNRDVPILYFGAHVHSTDNTSNVAPSLRRSGWQDFCIGGGGGWACDGPQGFVSGEVLGNGRVTNVRIKLMPMSTCCRGNPHNG